MPLRYALIAMFLFVTACTVPKAPPGWPAGDERPINPAHLNRPAK